MRNLLIALFIITGLGCADSRVLTGTDSPYRFDVDEDFINEYNAFIEEARIRNRDLSDRPIIIRYNYQLTTAARCNVQSQTIEVNRAYLKKGIIDYGTWFEEFIIFHELGHCLLNLGHRNDQNNIMIEGYPPSDFAYTSNRSYYLDMLFLDIFID